jgi:hypothetical protein
MKISFVGQKAKVSRLLQQQKHAVKCELDRKQHIKNGEHSCLSEKIEFGFKSCAVHHLEYPATHYYRSAQPHVVRIIVHKKDSFRKQTHST